jgi:hypothetical protein
LRQAGNANQAEWLIFVKRGFAELQTHPLQSTPSDLFHTLRAARLTFINQPTGRTS